MSVSNQISPAGLLTGLYHVSTGLTAYNRAHIPLCGALCGPITWQPGHPGTQPQRVNSYWYIADTPGSAILGLPSCKRLAVVKMNCAITVMQPGAKPPILHLFPQQQQQPCLLQSMQPPSPSSPLMT